MTMGNFTPTCDPICSVSIFFVVPDDTSVLMLSYGAVPTIITTTHSTTTSTTTVTETVTTAVTETVTSAVTETITTVVTTAGATPTESTITTSSSNVELTTSEPTSKSTTTTDTTEVTTSGVPTTAVRSTTTTQPTTRTLATTQPTTRTLATTQPTTWPTTQSTTTTSVPADHTLFMEDSEHQLMEDTPKIITLVAIHTDPLATLDFHVSNSSENLLVEVQGSQLIITPTSNFHGTSRLHAYATADELRSNTGTITITVTPVNDAPVAGSLDLETPEDVSIEGTLIASDVDGDDLSFSMKSPASHGSAFVADDGKCSYTPAPDFHGWDSFTYLVSDGSIPIEGVVRVRVLSVNDPPEAFNLTLTTNENTAVSHSLPYRDVDSTTVTTELVSTPSNGVVSLNGVQFTYAPNQGFNGTDTFSWRALDGAGLWSHNATVNVTVLAVDSAPVSFDANFEVHEDLLLYGTLNVSDIDTPIEQLRSEIVSAPQKGQVVLNGTQFLYSPNANENGIDGFLFRVTDNSSQSNPALVVVTVHPVNDPPAATSSAVQTVQGSSVAAEFNVTDVDSVVNISLVDLPSNGSVFIAEGSFLYTPRAEFVGLDTFNFTASDGEFQASAMVTVTVFARNGLPLAPGLIVNATEDTPVSGVLPGVPSTSSSGNLAYALLSEPQHGLLELNTNGSFTYLSALDFVGNDEFSYTTQDSSGTSAPGIVIILIAAVNDVPRVVDQTISINEDSLAASRFNVTDVDNNLSSLRFNASKPSPSGAVTLNDNWFMYQPADDFSGTVTFQYQASDDFGFSEAATVTIIVVPVNDPPIARSVDLEVATNDVVVWSLEAADVDSPQSNLVFFNRTAASVGEFLLMPNGTLVYRAGADSGVDTVNFQVTDGTLVSNIASVRFVVVRVNQPPLLHNSSVILDEDSSSTVVLQVEDDGFSTLTFEILDVVSFANITLIGERILIVPQANFFGELQFQVVAHDGEFDSNIATIMVTVLPIPDQPILKRLELTVTEDGVAHGVLEVVDLDEPRPGDLLTRSALTDRFTLEIGKAPTHGEAAIDGRNLTYSPNKDFSGTDTFTYAVFEHEGNVRLEQLVTAIVAAVNDPPVAHDQRADTNFNQAVSSSLHFSDVDTPQDGLVFELSSVPVNGTLSINRSNFVYTPNDNFSGTDTFSWHVYDGEYWSRNATAEIIVAPPPIIVVTEITQEDTLGALWLPIAIAIAIGCWLLLAVLFKFWLLIPLRWWIFHWNVCSCCTFEMERHCHHCGRTTANGFTHVRYPRRGTTDAGIQGVVLNHADACAQTDEPDVELAGQAPYAEVFPLHLCEDCRNAAQAGSERLWSWMIPAGYYVPPINKLFSPRTRDGPVPLCRCEFIHHATDELRPYAPKGRPAAEKIALPGSPEHTEGKLFDCSDEPYTPPTESGDIAAIREPLQISTTQPISEAHDISSATQTLFEQTRTSLQQLCSTLTQQMQRREAELQDSRSLGFEEVRNRLEQEAAVVESLLGEVNQNFGALKFQNERACKFSEHRLGKADDVLDMYEDEVLVMSHSPTQEHRVVCALPDSLLLMLIPCAGDPVTNQHATNSPERMELSLWTEQGGANLRFEGTELRAQLVGSDVRVSPVSSNDSWQMLHTTLKHKTIQSRHPRINELSSIAHARLYHLAALKGCDNMHLLKERWSGLGQDLLTKLNGQNQEEIDRLLAQAEAQLALIEGLKVQAEEQVDEVRKMPKKGWSAAKKAADAIHFAQEVQPKAKATRRLLGELDVQEKQHNIPEPMASTLSEKLQQLQDGGNAAEEQAHKEAECVEAAAAVEVSRSAEVVLMELDHARDEVETMSQRQAELDRDVRKLGKMHAELKKFEAQVCAKTVNLAEAMKTSGESVMQHKDAALASLHDMQQYRSSDQRYPKEWEQEDGEEAEQYHRHWSPRLDAALRALELKHKELEAMTKKVAKLNKYKTRAQEQEQRAANAEKEKDEAIARAKREIGLADYTLKHLGDIWSSYVKLNGVVQRSHAQEAIEEKIRIIRCRVQDGDGNTLPGTPPLECVLDAVEQFVQTKLPCTVFTAKHFEPRIAKDEQFDDIFKCLDILNQTVSINPETDLGEQVKELVEALVLPAYDRFSFHVQHRAKE